MKFPGIVATAVLLLAASHVQAAQRAQPDWIVTTNNSCKVWNPEPQPNESVTWSGGCENGFATGKGVLKWTENGKPAVEFDGVYAKGKRNGPGVIIDPDGKRFEGVWVDDKLVTGDGGSI
jgi:hypothetical protein